MCLSFHKGRCIKLAKTKVGEIGLDLVGITDDAMVVETMTRHKVRLIRGSYENIKVTTPEDMEIAGIFLKKRENNS